MKFALIFSLVLVSGFTSVSKAQNWGIGNELFDNVTKDVLQEIGFTPTAALCLATTFVDDYNVLGEAVKLRAAGTNAERLEVVKGFFTSQIKSKIKSEIKKQAWKMTIAALAAFAPSVVAKLGLAADVVAEYNTYSKYIIYGASCKSVGLYLRDEGSLQPNECTELFSMRRLSPATKLGEVTRKWPDFWVKWRAAGKFTKSCQHAIGINYMLEGR